MFIVNILTFHKLAPNALKGQKLLAQGNTLGFIIAASLSP